MYWKRWHDLGHAYFQLDLLRRQPLSAALMPTVATMQNIYGAKPEFVKSFGVYRNVGLCIKAPTVHETL